MILSTHLGYKYKKSNKKKPKTNKTTVNNVCSNKYKHTSPHTHTHPTHRGKRERYDDLLLCSILLVLPRDNNMSFHVSMFTFKHVNKSKHVKYDYIHTYIEVLSILLSDFKESAHIHIRIYIVCIDYNYNYFTFCLQLMCMCVYVKKFLLEISSTTVHTFSYICLHTYIHRYKCS